MFPPSPSFFLKHYMEPGSPTLDNSHFLNLIHGANTKNERKYTTSPSFPHLPIIRNCKQRLYWNTFYRLNDSAYDNKQDNVYGSKSTERCLQIESST